MREKSVYASKMGNNTKSIYISYPREPNHKLDEIAHTWRGEQ